MDPMYALLTVALTFAIIYWYLTKTYDYWKKQNVPSLPDPLLGFGHVWPVISLQHNITTFALDVYKKSSSSMVGFYFMRKPGLVLCDPDLVKNVLITNFSNFRKNGIVLNEKADPVLAKNPFFIDDPHRWKTARVRAINNLTSKNLKFLFNILKDVCANMSHYIDRKIKECNGQYESELKEHFTKYTAEIVANSAFGMEGHSFEDNPDKLAFVNVAKEIFEPTTLNGIKQAITFYLPSFSEFLNLGFVPKKTDAYFRENLKVIIKERRQNNLIPNDFLQFCLESNSEDDLDTTIADVLIFYVDVYETSSTVLSILFYNLSQNQEIQNKLRIHILSIMESNKNEVTYESLKNFTYLDQVISESLRIIPPLGGLIKVCTDEITLTGSDGLQCHVQPGSTILIPVMGLHNDNKYWENPHIFDPERFSSENQTKYREGAYLPFGDGPRMCLGMRLALMLVKLATVTLLSKYSVKHSTKTKMPMEMETTSIVTYAKGGLWAKFEKL